MNALSFWQVDKCRPKTTANYFSISTALHRMLHTATLVVIPSRTVQPFLYRGTTSAESSCQPFCRSLPYEQLPIFTSVLEALTIWDYRLPIIRSLVCTFQVSTLKDVRDLFPRKGGVVYLSTQYTAYGVWTHVCAVKGRCPSQLDEGDKLREYLHIVTRDY